MKEYIKKQIINSYEPKMNILRDENLLYTIECVAKEIIKSYKNGNKVLVVGNGGSAADSQHMVGELVSKFNFDRPGLPAISLTTNTSIITAIGNDYEYNRIFSRQVEANGNNGDILFAISTSGNSKSVIESINSANKKGITTIGLVGAKNCDMDNLCDFIIKVPSNETPRIQESHIMIEHIICGIVEKELFEDK
ncbi:SIS domain-containing protein [Romboutsia maritimum]|uniref:Phosphoheptose isomerase n=1 Tax=Romboutsia maritimum TaxID=2020948 RepID=A0A371IS47_9FIRM|nr:D-sedoheptulose 7-phosphate isomerase [Romboutsia maritimum]RDY23301.1 SIS domain-containing protein [Romboutsia maritimum]